MKTKIIIAVYVVGFFVTFGERFNIEEKTNCIMSMPCERAFMVAIIWPIYVPCKLSIIAWKGQP